MARKPPCLEFKHRGGFAGGKERAWRFASRVSASSRPLFFPGTPSDSVLTSFARSARGSSSLRSPPRLRSFVTAKQERLLLCNAVRAKVLKGGAEIFCRSGGAGDDIVDRKRLVRKRKPEGLLILRSPARATGKKIGASSPSEPKRRIVADTVGPARPTRLLSQLKPRAYYTILQP